MALRNRNPNPLNYFGVRRVYFIPPHFNDLTVNSGKPSLMKNINVWIQNNLNSRYYIGRTLVLDSSNTLVYNIHIGFEDEKEISYFLIACPFI